MTWTPEQRSEWDRLYRHDDDCPRAECQTCWSAAEFDRALSFDPTVAE